MTPPLVSVIIPCYNQGEFVTEAVESVLAQTIQDFEILIIDDGSTDGVTRPVLDRARWPHTTVFRTENRGLAAARNFLIAKASGEYLCALDADDRLAPHYFAATLDAFRSDDSLTFVGSRLQMFGAEDRITPEALTCDLPTLLVDCPLVSAALVRRAAVRDVGGYDEHVPGNEDWDLWISLVERGHRGLILPDVLFHYRRRPGSLCDVCTRGDVRLNHVAYLVRKHRDSYQAHFAHVMAEKSRAIRERQRVIEALERQVWTSRAALEARERDSTQGPSLRVSPDDTEALRQEYGRALTEIEALRRSASWRVTAPLRAAYDRLAGARRTEPPASVRPHTEPAGPPGRGPATIIPPAIDPTGQAADLESILLGHEAFLLRQAERQDQLQEEAHAIKQRLDVLNHQRVGQQSRDWLVAPGDVDFGHLRRPTPISMVWGTDRGRPVDRYYIAAFLQRHRGDIKGHVLEVKDTGYTRMFGDRRVEASDVLDIDGDNPDATVIADLAGADGIGRGRYDCFILTQTLGLIYDVRAALVNAAAALKPGGVLLCTLPASGRISYEPPGLDGDYWRFTVASITRLFADVFSADAFVVSGYGNVLARAAFLYGLADHELSQEELDAIDPYFPVIYGVRAVRTWP